MSPAFEFCLPVSASCLISNKPYQEAEHAAHSKRSYLCLESHLSRDRCEPNSLLSPAWVFPATLAILAIEHFSRESPFLTCGPPECHCCRHEFAGWMCIWRLSTDLCLPGGSEYMEWYRRVVRGSVFYFQHPTPRWWQPSAKCGNSQLILFSFFVGGQT